MLAPARPTRPRLHSNDKLHSNNFTVQFMVLFPKGYCSVQFRACQQRACYVAVQLRVMRSWLCTVRCMNTPCRTAAAVSMCNAGQGQPSWLRISLTAVNDVLRCSVPNPAWLRDGVCGTICGAVPEAPPEQVAFYWRGTVHGEGGDSCKVSGLAGCYTDEPTSFTYKRLISVCASARPLQCPSRAEPNQCVCHC